MASLCATIPYCVRKKGTSLEIRIPVYTDELGTPANLIGATAKFSYRRVGSTAAATVKVCTFDDNEIITGCTPAETLLMGGQYTYEIRLKTADGYIDGQIDGKFSIVDSINPWTT